MKTCAFTGHRPKGLGYPESDERCAALKEKLRSLIIRMIEEEGVTHFISGMAQGVDMYAAEIVLELKKRYPQITLECAIPYERQAVRWPEALRNRYFSIAERCDQETMLQRQYTPDCLRKRNQYMVDHADIVLAVWNGTSQWDGADGVVCQGNWEAGLDSPAGYLGNAIRKASLHRQRGFFFLMVRKHLSVG